MTSISSNERFGPSGSQSGWLFFVLGLLIAFFLGGAVRAFLSPQQLRFWVESAVAEQKPEFDVSFEDIELSLSSGIWPRLGVVVHGLTVADKDVCRSSFKWDVNEIYFPLSIRSLLKNELKLKVIKADQLSVTRRKSACSSASSASQAGTAPPKENSNQLVFQNPLPRFQSKIAEIRSFLKTQAASEFSKIRSWIFGLDINQISIMNEITLRQFQSRFTKDQVALQSAAYLNSAVGWAGVVPINIQLVVNASNIEANATSQYKEGQVTANFEWNVESDSAVFSASVQTFPAAEIFKSLNELRLTKINEGPRLLWFSCQLRGDLPLTGTRTIIVNLDDCGLDGEIGSIQASSIEFDLSLMQASPFKFQVKDVDLQKLSSAFHRTGPTGIMNRLGKLSGVGNFEKSDQITFDGEVKEAELIFSRKNERRLQKVSKISGSLSLENDRVSGVIDHMDLAHGAFKGLMSFNIDRKFRSGLIQVKIDQMTLDPAVQKILVGKQIQALSLYGQARIEDTHVIHWEGDAGTHFLQGDGWQAEDVKVHGVFENEELSGVLKAKSLQVNSSHSYFKWLLPLFLGDEEIADKITYKKLASRIKVKRSEGSWERAKAESGQGRVIFSSWGQWDAEGGLNGAINVDFPAMKLLKWELAGTYIEPQVSPSAVLVKELTRKNPGFTVPKNEPFERLQFFEQALSKERIAKIKAIGKQVIDSAKRLLPYSGKGRAESEVETQADGS